LIGSAPPSNAARTTLLDHAKLGDAVAWQRLQFLYTPLVRWWCRRHGAWQPQDLEDVTEEVFLAVTGKPAAFMKGPPGSFVHTAKSRVLGRLR
jgi:hypothetical protein